MKKEMYRERLSNVGVLNDELEIIFTFEKVETKKIYIFFKDGTLNEEGYKNIYVSTLDNKGRIGHGGIRDTELKFLNEIYEKYIGLEWDNSILLCKAKQKVNEEFGEKLPEEEFEENLPIRTITGRIL